jgi:potassium efflux system protein
MVSGSFVTAVDLHAQAVQTAVARTEPGRAGDLPPLPSLAEIEAELAAVESDQSLEDAVKSGLRDQYQQVIGALRSAAEFEAQAQGFRAAIRSGPDTLAALRSELERLEAVDEPVSAEITGSVDELSTEIDVRRALLTGLRTELAEVTAEAVRTDARPVEVIARTPAVQRELAPLRQQLESLPIPEGGESDRQRRERLLLQARELQLTRELEMLQAEQESQSIRREILQARSDLLGRQIRDVEAAMARLSEVVDERRGGTAALARAAVAELPPELMRGQPALAAVAREVADLADDLDRAIDETRQAESAEQRVRRGFEELVAESANVREQLQLGGGGRAIVQLLFSLDRQCAKAQQELRDFVVTSPDAARLAALHAREKLRAQGALEEAFPGPRAEPVQALLDARRELLVDLDRQHSALVMALGSLEVRRHEYLDETEAIRGYIGEQLFGFGLRASPVVSVDTVLALPRGLAWEFQAAHWLELGRGLRWAVVRMPLASGAVFLLVVGLVLRRRHMIRALEAAGARVRRTSTDRYGNTLEALLWTVLLAVPVPLTVWYSAVVLERLPEPSDWRHGLIAGLTNAAWILLAAAFVWQLMRPQGLAAAHLGWREERFDRLQTALRALATVYVPALVLTLSCVFGEASVHFASLGRISFMLAHLWMAFVFFRLFFSADGLLALANGSEGREGLARWPRFVAAVLVAAPLSLVVLMALGYMISSIMLSLGLLATLILATGGAILYGLALRWFRMRQRKLALAEALERRRRGRERAASSETGSEIPSDLAAMVEEEESGPDLDVVGEQTRGLLRAIFGLATLLAILAYWSEAFPLVELARGVKLEFLGGLSLLQLAVAILNVVVFAIVARNLPGLLELAVLRGMNVAAGTRHAIATLVQYAVIAVGAAVVLGVIQVDWAKFGWIAAALSVGLGFGLQEVVANFVCGLILLFERPIRVGDIVTVEGMTGTVTRIQMRATTIINWDRQEFVVPNKTLITSTLLNWTLSTTVNRLVIPVGIAYGSDTALARRLLLEVAGEQPEILDDPEPMATFEQFADSSLNIVLRAFLPDMDNRLAVISALHTQIHQRFAEAGIEIAFPQLDLHVRSGWKSSAPAAEAGDR